MDHGVMDDPFVEIPRFQGRQNRTSREGCPKIAANKITDLCGVYYPDRIPYSPP
jgi:hypothetical protein